MVVQPPKSVFTLLFPALTSLRLGAVVLVCGALGAAGWWHPASPNTMARADALLGRGRPDAAVVLYDAAAAHSPWGEVREQALHRSAMVYATDLGDPVQARRRLRELLTDAEGPLAAEAWETIGHLLLKDERKPDGAARAFHKSWEAAPDTERGALRLEYSARALLEAGRDEDAVRAWDLFSETYPALEALALVAKAEARLAAGDAEAALALYSQAERVTESGDVAALARLGTATCLERLGNLDGALAAIDAVDLPEDVREVRVEGLRARRAAGAGSL